MHRIKNSSLGHAALINRKAQTPLCAAAGLVVESLEERRMLAVSFDLTAGVLTVNGTGGNDQMSIALNGGSIIATVNGEDTPNIDPAQVTSIILNGQAGDDVLALGDGLVGATLNGGIGNDTLVSGSRTDPTASGQSDDHLVGGADNDLYVFHDDWGQDVIVENAGEGNDTLDFSAIHGDLVFNIGALNVHDDHNTANQGGDDVENLVGGSGNDLFVFGDGAVTAGTIDGGAGSNTLDYTNYSTAVTVNLSNGTATGTTGVSAISNIIGGQGNDTLTGDANANNLNGGPGSDHLNGGGGADTFPRGTADGAGADTITEPDGTGVPLDFSSFDTPLVFTISATAVTVSSNGNVLATGPTKGTLRGGSANDRFVFADGATYDGTIDGGGGANLLDYSAYTTGVSVNLTNGTSTGTAGVLQIRDITGGASRDRLVGDAGNNVIVGGGGNDVVDGKDGNDIVRGGNGNDTVKGGNGNDKVYGDAGTDKLYGQNGNDHVYGGTGNDLLNGGTGKDVLSGSANNDTFVSNDNTRDTLSGGTGKDKVGKHDKIDKLLSIEVGK